MNKGEIALVSATAEEISGRSSGIFVIKQIGEAVCRLWMEEKEKRGAIAGYEGKNKLGLYFVRIEDFDKKDRIVHIHIPYKKNLEDVFFSTWYVDRLCIGSGELHPLNEGINDGDFNLGYMIIYDEFLCDENILGVDVFQMVLRAICAEFIEKDVRVIHKIIARNDFDDTKKDSLSTHFYIKKPEKLENVFLCDWKDWNIGLWVDTKEFFNGNGWGKLESFLTGENDMNLWGNIDIEAIAESIHNAWWEEKKKQGVKDHPDMVQYDDLPEDIKEYDRVTAKTTIEEIRKAILSSNREKNISFGAAVEAAKRGRKIARAGWNGKNQYVELATAISYRNARGETINAEHDAIGNKALAFVGTSGVQLGWLASQADMLAEDWVIIDE